MAFSDAARMELRKWALAQFGADPPPNVDVDWIVDLLDLTEEDRKLQVVTALDEQRAVVLDEKAALNDEKIAAEVEADAAVAAIDEAKTELSK